MTLAQQMKRIAAKALEDQKVAEATKDIREDLKKLDDVQSDLRSLGLLRSSRSYSRLLSPSLLSPTSTVSHTNPSSPSPSPPSLSASSLDQHQEEDKKEVKVGVEISPSSPSPSSSLVTSSDLSASSIPLPLIPPEMMIELQEMGETISSSLLFSCPSRRSNRETDDAMVKRQEWAQWIRSFRGMDDGKKRLGKPSSMISFSLFFSSLALRCVLLRVLLEATKDDALYTMKG